MYQGTCAFVFLLLQSPSPVRHSFYEVFLHGHIAGAALAIGAVWVHLKDRPQQLMLYGVIALWVMERTIRFARLILRNVGSGGTQADVEVLPGDALRVTVRMARPWTFRPGQHAYLYMPSVGLWTNHPFSVAWSDEEEDLSVSSSMADEKGLPMNRQDILEHNKTSMSFIIRRRTGFTDKLFKKADLSAAGRFSTSAFVEGPYGKCRRLLFPRLGQFIVHQSICTHANVITQAAKISALMALSCSGLLVLVSRTRFPTCAILLLVTQTVPSPLVA
jgi:hypothetical protein